MKTDLARELFDQIAASGNADLKSALFASTIRCAGIRAEWAIASPEQRREMDASRTGAKWFLIDRMQEPVPAFPPSSPETRIQIS
jgi:hypothetical protein